MRVLTGVQPSGTAHLGNLFGAMLPAIEISQKNSAIIFIADLHALTTFSSGEEIKKNTINLAADLLALGLDPEKTIFFRQSQVPQHLELAWILANFAPSGLLKRSHSYKDKISHGISPSMGLFFYPILMAADILLYAPDVVPVGKDQKQHLEIARDITDKFNQFFGQEILKLPQPQIAKDLGVVPGIDGQKMSKSYGNTIEIFGDSKNLRKKIFAIKTDSAEISAKKDPEKNIIFQIFKLFGNKQEIENLAEKFRAGGLGYGEAKKILWEKAEQFLSPLRKKREKIIQNPEKILETLRTGESQAKKIAEKLMTKIRKKMGILN